MQKEYIGALIRTVLGIVFGMLASSGVIEQTKVDEYSAGIASALLLVWTIAAEVIKHRNKREEIMLAIRAPQTATPEQIVEQRKMMKRRTSALAMLLLLSTYPTISAQAQHSADVEAQAFVMIEIDREAATLWLNGECIPTIVGPQRDKPSLNIIIRRNGPTDNVEWTAALILALGIVPDHAVIELDIPIPAGFKHIDIIDHHNGHIPFRAQRLIGREIRPVVFCR
jgi:hypothetical protein